MRKFMPFLLLFLLVPILAMAQLAPALTTIDFSNAEITQSGPDSFYIRNVALPDQTISITISLNDENHWEITDVVPESDNILPANVILDFATVEALDDGSVEIDWILYDGEVLSGRLSLADDEISVSDMFSSVGSFSDPTLDFPEALNTLLKGRDANIVQDKLTEVRTEYEAKISALQSQYDAIEAERDNLSAKAGTLQTQIDSLTTDKKSLESKNKDLQSQIDGLKSENSALQTEVSKLKEDLNSLSSTPGAGDSSENLSIPANLAAGYLAKLDTLENEISSLETLIEKLETAIDVYATMAGSEIAALEEAIDGIDITPEVTVEGGQTVESRDYSDEFSQLKRSIDDIESAFAEYAQLGDDRIVELEETLTKAVEDAVASIELPAQATPSRESTTDASDAQKTISLLNGQIEKLKAENEKLTDEMEELKETILAELIGEGFIAALKPSMTWALASGFDTSEAQLGLWKVGPNYAAQLDPSMLFGKLLLPINQELSPVLYSFKARSTDPPDDWVGFGLHIYVENVSKRGYGLGHSLLVWLTRDREVYKTNYTYLQLYRSDDDVHMERVMDAVIPEPITEYVRVEVLYEPVNQYITIAVDGEEKIRYKTWFDIDSGIEVALRSLGTAEFSDLEIKTLP